MSDLRIVEAELWHIDALGRTMRVLDAAECRRLGMEPNAGLLASFAPSRLRRTALVRDNVAAMWGVAEVECARPWLATGEAIRLLASVTFVREYQGQVREMAARYRVLENWCDARHAHALRLLRLAGFTVHGAAPFGPHGEMFHRFDLRA